MRTQFAAAAVALALCCSTCDLSRASILNPTDGFDTVKLHNGIGTTGGIFHVDKNPSGPVSLDFDTFCVQTLEMIAFDTKYTVYNVAKETFGSVQNGVNLSSFGSWLYSGFLGLDDDMDVASFLATGFDVSTTWKVNALQAGIWQSLGYSVPFAITTAMQDMLDDWAEAFGDDTEWAAQDLDDNMIKTGNIYIMNLVTPKWDGTYKHHQDQLVYIPPPPDDDPPPPFIPEPMSFLVWSLLAMCFGSAGLRCRD